MRHVGMVLLLGFLPIELKAEAVSILSPAHLSPTAGAIVRHASADAETRNSASLFAALRAMVDPLSPQISGAGRFGAGSGVSGRDVVVIRNIIEQAESRRDGYDAVQHGARIKPPKRPTAMTLGEIYRWIDRTPGQPHAIGRYQFIPKTLRRVARIVGAQPSDRFSPALQDRLADVLLADAGLHEFRGGEMSRRTFMGNLAKIWAGLPMPSGRSYYAGIAGNKASMSWARFDAQMAQITPG